MASSPRPIPELSESNIRLATLQCSQGIGLRHTCDYSFCVNPDHLFVGTHSDNMRGMLGKNRGPGVGPGPPVNVLVQV